MYKYFLFITLLLLFSSNHVYSQCIDSPLFGDKKLGNCPQIDEDFKSPNGIPKSAIVDDSGSSTNMIQILFTCDQATPELCTKAKRAFNNAADVISNTLDLKQPITINCSFVDLCVNFLKCPPGASKPLGAAGPARFIPLKDDDNIVRLYPQALVKQLQLPRHPEFSSLDITAGFNSKNDIFWFRGDPPIGKAQVDFEIVLVHEFLHGLGFITSWDDYLNDNATSLTPFAPFVLGNGKKGVTFTGFREYVLDKYLVATKDNSPLTLVTSKINQFAPINTKFVNKDEFNKAFIKSPQYVQTTNMFENGITKGSIAFRIPGDNENALMETGLIPYRSGSSFTHLDFDAFSNTTDFLMRFKAPRNADLDDIGVINYDPKYTNPIGPKTIRILQTIGYSVKPNPGTFKIESSAPDAPAPAPAAPPAGQPQPSQTTSKSTKSNNLTSENSANTHTTNSLLLLSTFIITILFF